MNAERYDDANESLMDHPDKKVVRGGGGGQNARKSRQIFAGTKSTSMNYEHLDPTMNTARSNRCHSLCHYLINSANPKCASDTVVLPFSPLADSKSNPDVISLSATSVSAAGRQASQEDQNPLYQVSNEFIRIVGGQPMKAFLKRPVKAVTAAPTHKLVAQNEREELLQVPSPVESPKLPKKKCGYFVSDSLQTNWSERLRRRKILFFRRIKITDFCLGFALTGIALTVAENEIAYSSSYHKEFLSVVFLSANLFVTLALLIGILLYHATEIQNLMNNTGAEDWRVALTFSHGVQITTELIICSISPLPVKFYIDWHVISEDRYTVRTIPISINIILSSFVFLRLYLLCRFMALHSKQFQDAATRSIAALNRITVDFDFVLKTMIAEHPIRVLLLLTGILWLVMAWLFCQCERYNGQNEGYLFANSIWFIIITFLSVGYGDVTPRTFCGRGVALTTGILGAGVSSALIAVISRHMELTRAEKQVNNFMSDTKLEKQRKDVAAKVLQYRWFIHKYCGSKRSIDRAKLRNYQRKFLTAINEFKHVKWEQRKTAEEGNALMDLAKMQRVMHESLFDARKQQESIIHRLDILNKSIQNLQHATTLMNSNSSYVQQRNAAADCL